MSDGTPLRLAVFDVDGTLVDSLETIAAAMGEAFTDLDLGAPDPDAVRRVIGLSLLEAAQMLLPEADPGTWTALVDAYRGRAKARLDRPGYRDPLYPGALDTLRALEGQGYLLGLATGKSRRGVERFLDQFGLRGRFVTTQTADDGPSKPHPAMLDRAMAEAGVDRHQAVMIGDTTYDMEMAANAGILAVGVAWGYHRPDDLKASGARVVLERFERLPEELCGLMGE